MLLIGTDEAGYGPNLGPLVVAATAWSVPDEALPPDLYSRLASVITPVPLGRGANAEKLAVADSKALYSPATGVRTLEIGALALAASIDVVPGGWKELWRAFAPSSRDLQSSGPWFADYDAATPFASSLADISSISTRLKQAYDQTECRMLAMRAAVIAPEEFNDRVDALGGKGVLLSETTLSLIQQLLELFPSQPAFVTCDKHGGRNRYIDLLQRRWTDDLIEIREESRATSRYRWGPKARRVEIEFRVGGEAMVPCAAASMLAKYLRERSMEAFNAFWCARVPGLAPTAGYPVDALRFRRDVDAVRQSLEITDQAFWRKK